jgi:hypothetical protein
MIALGPLKTQAAPLRSSVIPVVTVAPRLQTRGFSLVVAEQIFASEEASYRLGHLGRTKNRALILIEDVNKATHF